MIPQIKQRIEQIRRGEVPEGYKNTKGGIVPDEWVEDNLGRYLSEYKKLSNDIEKYPVYSSSRQGLIPQSKYYDNREAVETCVGYKIVPTGYVTYRHMSDDDIFHFNVNRTGGKILVSSEYPVFTVSDKGELGYIVPMLNDTARFRYFCRTQKLGGTRTRLYYKNLCTYRAAFPTYPEQKKIADILSAQDKVIELQQKKIDELKRLKKVYLSKMFPKKGCNVPEIRFPGFTDPWEQRKLGEMGQTYTGLSGKTKDDFGHGQARFVTYMNVYSNPISNPEMTEPIEIDPKQNEVEVGDVFFTTSSETPEEVGMSSILLEKRGKTYLNSFCFGFRPSEKIDRYYLAYMLRSESARAKITLLAQGISRYNISKNKVMEIAVSLPSLDEQKMIGQYFSQLDNLITLHQRKCDEEKQKKKALMQLLLTGIVRVEVKQ